MYITADDNTKEYFERFKTIKILDPSKNIEKTWQVVGVDLYYGDGIIQVFLDEYFENSIADAAAAEKIAETQEKESMHETTAYIDGPTSIQQYETNGDITVYWDSGIRKISNRSFMGNL